ncbi:hypothetical protein FO519_001576 [Halicephalobus sp. NKZ332]|nr:hypothetical protein FO519_001576 [Halicephalobus sp. NKZ332]
MIQIFSYLMSLFWIFSIVAARSCSLRPMPIISGYIEKFNTPIELDNPVNVTCNDILTWDLEMKPLKFTTKNVKDGEFCRIWLPGGIQLQFISSVLSNSDAGVVLREGCRNTLIYQSKFLRDFNNVLSPLIRKDFGAMDFYNFAKKDILIFRFKNAFPLYAYDAHDILDQYVDHN